MTIEDMAPDEIPKKKQKIRAFGDDTVQRGNRVICPMIQLFWIAFHCDGTIERMERAICGMLSSFYSNTVSEDSNLRRCFLLVLNACTLNSRNIREFKLI